MFRMVLFYSLIIIVSTLTLSVRAQSFELHIKVDSTAYTNFKSNKVLIFEKYFNDSVQIFYDDSLYYGTKIVTNLSTERVDNTLYLKETAINKCFSIKLESGEVITIPIMNPRYVYIGRNVEDAWFVLYSSELRIYK